MALALVRLLSSLLNKQSIVYFPWHWHLSRRITLMPSDIFLLSCWCKSAFIQCFERLCIIYCCWENREKMKIICATCSYIFQCKLLHLMYISRSQIHNLVVDTTMNNGWLWTVLLACLEAMIICTVNLLVGYIRWSDIRTYEQMFNRILKGSKWMFFFINASKFRIFLCTGLFVLNWPCSWNLILLSRSCCETWGGAEDSTLSHGMHYCLLFINIDTKTHKHKIMLLIICHSFIWNWNAKIVSKWWQRWWWNSEWHPIYQLVKVPFQCRCKVAWAQWMDPQSKIHWEVSHNSQQHVLKACRDIVIWVHIQAMKAPCKQAV